MRQNTETGEIVLGNHGEPGVAPELLMIEAYLGSPAYLAGHDTLAAMQSNGMLDFPQRFFDATQVPARSVSDPTPRTRTDRAWKVQPSFTVGPEDVSFVRHAATWALRDAEKSPGEPEWQHLASVKASQRSAAQELLDLIDS